MFPFTSSAVVAALVISTFALPAPDAGAKPFTKQNGQDALALNDKFASLTAASPCTDGENACVGGKFGQCAGGKFQLTACGAGTVCVALPLVNKPGTSVTCDTAADKDARIAATGATGAVKGSSAAAASPAAADSFAAAPKAGSSAPAAAPSGAKSFTLQNGKDAQALNAKFEGLTPSSSCTDGENACINNQFAQCANGKFVLTSCAAGLQCAALPLVNSAGTSITCVDQPQALERIKATGAGASLTGN